MYGDSIILLKQQGINVAPGLTSEEIRKIEGLYSIRFPKSFKQFLMEGVPISKGFYNWRNYEHGNIQRIKQMISFPVEQISELADEVEWCEEWGEEPDNRLDIERIVKMRLERAPKLLPIYAHRYIPIFSNDDPPILSIHDTDVIYYGENLKEYFEVEFGKRRHGDIDQKNIRPIPFWSDIM